MDNKVVKNAFWIIICKVIQSILGLVISMLSARYLGPSNFGIINYAASIVAFVTPIMQLGFRSTLIKEFINRPESEGTTMGTALILNIISAVACMVGIFGFVFFTNANQTVTIIVCVLYSVSLLFQAGEMLRYWFQAKLLSKYTSVISLVAYVIVAGYRIFLLVTEKSIYWFAVSYAVDYAIIALLMLFTYKKVGKSKLRFSWKLGKQMLSRSRYYIVSTMMVTIFQQTDKMMLKNMVDDTAVGIYSAAVACAGFTGFVYIAIIDSMRPVILESKKVSTDLFNKNMSRLFAIVFFISLLQCVFMTVLAKPVIYLLYGEEYLSAVPALQIIVWYVTYAYFGTVRNVWILAQEKQHVLWIINLTGALLNVVLNLFFIPIWGIYGAAIASLITQVFTNFVLGFILKPIREANMLMLKGINPKFMITEASDVLKKLKLRKNRKKDN